MTASQQKVLQMVAEGTVTPDEGQQLLAALGARRRSAWSWLFNPMAALSTRWTLGLTAAVVLAAAMFGTRGLMLDGALDAHAAALPLSDRQLLAELLAALVVPSAVFWLTGLIARGPMRVVDALALMGLAHVPLVAAAPVVLWLPRSPDPAAYLSPLVMVLALVTVALVGWSITVLVMSYRTVTRLTGARLVVSLLAGLVVAEGASKLVWHWVA